MTGSNSIASPEEVVRAYYADVSEGRFDDAAGRLSPDSTLWILGEGHWPLGGRHDLSSLRRIHASVAERYGGILPFVLREILQGTSA